MKTIKVVGLPGSGKTTFIAALWHVLQAGEIASSLELERLDGDSTYLDEIATAWRSCKPVPRTSMKAEKPIAMHVRDTRTRSQAVLEMPDLSGETFRQQLEKGKAEGQHALLAQRASGIIVFLNANRRSEGVPLSALSGLVEPPSSAMVPPVAWSIDAVPEQVQLFLLLKSLRSPAMGGLSQRRLSVVVSAWDVVAPAGCAPENWLRLNRPLLHQHLSTNPDAFNSQYFGVSAQGGDLEDATRRAGLLHATPSERIRCRSGADESHDLTLPLRWLMS